MSQQVNQLKDMATVLRRDSLLMTTSAGSGHPTTCLSAAEILSAVLFGEMSFDTTNPHNPDNDEFVLSKGHAAPILYAAFYRAGAMKHPLDTLRMMGSPYEGHPLPSTFPWAKVATGSLGQGLSVGVGMALAAKMQKRKYRTYVLCGDSEIAEGSVYEALAAAVHYRLDNLCVIVDVNRLGQSGQTMLGHDLKSYEMRMKSFGAETIVVDGHSIEKILGALKKARSAKGKPAVILAKTFKGKGVSFLQNKEGWHGKTLDKAQLEAALKELPNPKVPAIKIRKPTPSRNSTPPQKSLVKIKPAYSLGQEVATRQAYGSALASLGRQNPLVVATDGETSNSTFSEMIKKDSPSQYVEAFIAEQNMVGMALGMAVKGMHPFASTFAAFFTRAHDQIRMAALSSATMTFVGSHAGVSIGEDGPSQMALEDLGMFRALPNSTVLYPSDAVSAEKLVAAAYQSKNITYIRTSRPKTKVIYKATEEFPIGGFKVVRSPSNPVAVLAGAGVTLHEALKAADQLAQDHLPVAVVDIYSIKPFTAPHQLVELVKRANNTLVVIEDHYPEGGIAEMLGRATAGSAIRIHSMAVTQMPHSAKPMELLNLERIDAASIVQKVRSMMPRRGAV